MFPSARSYGTPMVGRAKNQMLVVSVVFCYTISNFLRCGGVSPMTDTEQSVLTLLRRALFGCELPLPSDVDWQRVFEEAVSHSVHLLVYDCLTEQERAAIPKETAVPWRQEVLSAMWYNEQLLGEQQEVLKALSGLPCVILKGSSSAACYPRPELRCAGDIDLLLFE